MADLCTTELLDAPEAWRQHWARNGIAIEREGSTVNRKDFFETIYYIAGTVGAVGTLLAAISALNVYVNNSRLERARWASNL